MRHSHCAASIGLALPHRQTLMKFSIELTVLFKPSGIFYFFFFFYSKKKKNQIIFIAIYLKKFARIAINAIILWKFNWHNQNQSSHFLSILAISIEINNTRIAFDNCLHAWAPNCTREWREAGTVVRVLENCAADILASENCFIVKSYFPFYCYCSNYEKIRRIDGSFFGASHIQSWLKSNLNPRCAFRQIQTPDSAQCERAKTFQCAKAKWCCAD